ncbi:T6SS effector BTH_I2691 family protein [Pseudomonas sp. NPDC089752]|uniref:T6SS effector BTH_I2691 family protein n=1 Tax=Pseudomonas sp. NPDC089752 TaxID=3364472 RepID=UPI003801580D
MSISQSIATLVAETDFLLTPCKACQRQGLPILPLRQALVPDTRPGRDSATQTRMGLRTLRSGYLYVLLDQRIWHAYEVTDHGHLRRFNPYEPPPGPPPPLPERCTQADHDLPSSFLNIDTEAYGSAWLAFSSDAWPVSVLQAYRNGQAPAHRFEGLDLTQARNNPELLGLAMTPDNLQVDKQVFEYAQQLNGPFDSAHGFHSRFLRKFALRGYVVNAMQQHALENGVLAVVLDDTVGLVQEYNHQRLNWVVKRQAWREDPLRAYQLQTSQILKIIRETQREWAAQEIQPSFEPQTGDGPPMFTDRATERQRLVDVRQRESDEKLEERYDEPRRAAFQADYDQQELQFQRHIDQHAAAYVAYCESAAFALIERHDYDGRNRESGIAYTKTMAGCLAGGITKAPSTSAEPDAPAAGTSAALWLKWLQDPNSPAYRALLLRDVALLAALLPSFSQTEPNNWNDSEKLYTALSKFIASEDAGLKLRDALKQSVTELQGAVNAASQRLAVWLDPGVQQVVRHLNSASQRIYNGVHLVELQVQMKLGEYYALQSAHLRELQNSASEKLAKARTKMMPPLHEVMAGVENKANKVKPIIQTGLLSLAVLDPKVAHTVVNVSVWVEGTAHELHERLASEAKLNVNQLGPAAQMTLVDLKVAAGTLEPSARKLLDGMRISAGQASRLVSDGFTGLRGTGKGWELLFSIGGLYLLSDSLGKNLKKAEEELGPKSSEAMMALYGSSVGILGGGIELFGLLMPHKKTIPNNVSIGRTVARAGAIVSAVAGIFDISQALAAKRRSLVSGDENAHKLYRRAVISATFGTGSAFAAVLFPTLLGPLGLAIVFGLATFALMRSASLNESTPLEQWARRCYFGIANEHPSIHWNSPNHADIALSELNACTLGLTSQITFQTNRANHSSSSKIGGLVNIETNTTLKFKLELPLYSESRSSYHYTLVIHRAGDGSGPCYSGGEVIINIEHAAPNFETRALSHSSLTPSQSPRIPDYKPETIKIIEKTHSPASSGDSSHIKVIIGSVELNSQLGRHNILSASLVVAYWPDRNIPNAAAEIMIQEEKQ